MDTTVELEPGSRDDGGNQAIAVRSARPPYGGEALVSVVVPTRNRCELLSRALRSVQAQSYPLWEVIVVDDGSSDGSADMVAALGDPRIRWVVNDERRGAGYSRHFGAELARGAFVAFLDSDDWWLPQKLWLQLDAAERMGGRRQVLICPPACDDGNGALPVEQPILRPGQPIADYVYAGRQATVLSSCILVDGDFARRRRFDKRLRVNQDTDYLLRLERHGARFHCIETPLYVLDTRRRTDRISVDPGLSRESLAWYYKTSGGWSRQARRGYLLWDLSLRCASTGRRGMGLLYFLRGLSLEAGPYRVLRQFLRVLGGGDVPQGLKWLRRQLRSLQGDGPLAVKPAGYAGSESPRLRSWRNRLVASRNSDGAPPAISRT